MRHLTAAVFAVLLAIVGRAEAAPAEGKMNISKITPTLYADGLRFTDEIVSVTPLSAAVNTQSSITIAATVYECECEIVRSTAVSRSATGKVGWTSSLNGENGSGEPTAGAAGFTHFESFGQRVPASGVTGAEGVWNSGPIYRVYPTLYLATPPALDQFGGDAVMKVRVRCKIKPLTTWGGVAR